ncbi:response regulator [Altererythrobacter sp.]|uniref:response regulator n=1 Tax=Altererythrobacter sp. TaxID=1872480 RepID=UPI003CFD2931
MPSLRILVAEDECIVAMDLCETVTEAGFIVEGPHGEVSSAMQAFHKRRPDLAILDVQLSDGVVFPLARQLAEQDVPIIFHSCHFTRDEVWKRFPGAKTLSKPCPPNEMIAALNEALHLH